MPSPTEPSHGHLEVRSDVDDGVVRIALRGEADLNGVEPLRDALARLDLDGRRQPVQIDVSDLALVDLAVLRELTFFAIR